VEISVPEIKSIIPLIVEVEASFKEESHIIKEWMEKHRQSIQYNKQLILNKSEQNDVKILVSLLTDLLIRAMRGERGDTLNKELRRSIHTKQDLTYENYLDLLKRANYRWGATTGAQVIMDVVNIFENRYGWDWKVYFDEVDRHAESNFLQDKLLEIKYIDFKVRDLALSSFNPNYVANDLHVVRVISRIGLLNCGFDLLGDNNLEMGNNPTNRKNYLFLHKLALKLSKLTDDEYSPADLDRIFWNFGRSICNANPKCLKCPIKNQCLTGRHRG
jgi:endonuclease III